MDMSFGPWSSYQLVLIFEWWRIETPFQFAISCIFVCVATASYHALRYSILCLEFSIAGRMTKSSQTHNERSANNLESGLGFEETFLVSNRAGSSVLNVAEQRSITHLRVAHAALSGLSYCLALLLMLVAMTYNSSLFVALILGYALGDYLFFLRASRVGMGASVQSPTAGAAAVWSYQAGHSDCH